MDSNNSQKKVENNLLDEFANGMDSKELANEIQKLKAEFQQIKEANSNQFGGTSMMQMVWQMGMQTVELKKEMDGLKAEIRKLNEENTGLKRKLANMEEEFVGKNAKLEGKIAEKNEAMGKMKKEICKIKAENDGEKIILEGKMCELQKQKAEKETPVDLTGSIYGMEFFELYPNELKNNKWNTADCGSKLTITSEGRFVVKHNGQRDNSIRAILPIPFFNLNVTKPSIAGYFEVQIVHKTPKCYVSIGIGFCTKQFPLEGKLLGNEENSFAIYSKAGMIISGQFKGFGNANEYFKVGDVIGFGIIHFPANSPMKCFATLNGELLGEFELPDDFANIQFYPAVSISTCHESIRANFGQEMWRFNPNQLLQ